MVITYHGHQFFRVQYGEVIIALDPPAKDSDFDSSRFKSTIAMSSVRHPDMNGGETLAGDDGQNPFIMNSPGEYEVQGISVKGLSSQSQYKDKEWINTIYYFTLEDMNVCFLGALSNTDLPSHTSERIGAVDILFVPIGGEGVLNPADAYKLAVRLEAQIIIPMNYDNDSLDKFLKEEGSKDTKPEDKLTLKRRDLSGEEGEVVVLNPQ